MNYDCLILTHYIQKVLGTEVCFDLWIFQSIMHSHDDNDEDEPMGITKCIKNIGAHHDDTINSN